MESIANDPSFDDETVAVVEVFVIVVMEMPGNQGKSGAGRRPLEVICV